MILTTKSEVLWSTSNKNYFCEKGYSFSNYNEKILVNTEDLNEISGNIIEIKCNECGKVFLLSYKNYCKRKNEYKDLCPDCLFVYKNKIKNIKKYNKIVKMCSEKGYVLKTNKEDIVNGTNCITYICPIHGERIIGIKDSSFNISCYWCGRNRSKIIQSLSTLNRRQNALYTKALDKCKENGYCLESSIDDIKNNKSYIVYICHKHGKQEMRIANLISGKKCPECAYESRRKRCQIPTDEIVSRIKEYNGNVLNPEEYINQTTKNLKISCPVCGEYFLTSLRNFCQHQGQVCRECTKKSSNGELLINEYLLSKKVAFTREKWFSDCRSINPLPFDFYLDDLNICIEFDGRQHFEETKFFSYPLEIVKLHDEIKTRYCKDKNIELIRIPYWDINKIENILDTKIKFT